MKNQVILALLFAAAILTSGGSFSQQNNTLFYMHKVPQSMLVNPAIQSECKIFVGIPVLSSIHLNLGMNGFSFNQVLPYDESIDSVIHPFHPLFDFDDFVHKKLRRVNYITFETQINLLSGGYKWKKFYFSLFITEKIDAKISFPRDLIIFAHELNALSFLGKTADFNGLGVNATHYREYAAGVSWKLNDKLTIGARPKLLFGKANVWTKKNTLTWLTDHDELDYTINTNLELVFTQPAYEFKKFAYDYKNDSLMFEMDTLDVEAKPYILNKNNMGLGLDLGGEYKLTDKIMLYGSLLDMGYIKWKDNTTRFIQKNEFYYDGMDIVPFLTEDDSIIDDHLDFMKDSILHIFEIQQTNDDYYSFLTPKLQLLGTYRLNDKIMFGALARSMLLQNGLHSSLTLSANTDFFKWLSASLSYSVINNSFKNVGIGLALKGGAFQFYFITDNIFALFPRGASHFSKKNNTGTDNILAIIPKSARNINLRFGFNFLFGCGKKKSATLID